VAVVRDFALVDREGRQSIRVREPELDMNRHRPQTSALGRAIQMLKWLAHDREIVGSPKRSVGRELEEAWPSGEK
jgi:hypothetical protein